MTLDLSENLRKKHDSKKITENGQSWSSILASTNKFSGTISNIFLEQASSRQLIIIAKTEKTHIVMSIFFENFFMFYP
jgi:hypothetical protein